MLKPLYQSLLLTSISSFTWADSAPVLSLSQNTIEASHSIIAPFKAEYSIIHKSKEVGKGIRQLEKLADNTYSYSYETDIEWLIFDDKRTEKSIVKLSNNIVIPTHYTYSREGTGRDKYYEWTYDITNNSAKNLKKDKRITIEFPDNIQDSLSYHLQHRLNLIQNPKKKHFVYPVIKSSGSTRNYVYEYDGEEEIMLPYGLVSTIKLKREIAEKKRITYAWFAPELNYLLVKLYQVKNGVEQFEAQLTSIESSK